MLNALQMDIYMNISLAIGVFLANWLVVPIFFKRRMYDGFFIGLIAGAAIFVLGHLFLSR